MTGFAGNTPSVSRYWNELKNISDEEKISLIALLSSSMVHEKQETDTPKKGWASRFSGVWKDSRSAEEIIADIRAARTQNTFTTEL
ncbi:MAG: hypothetical protein K6D37_07245 [Prevotella sp.]|nr:hypothetical protein [Prevotella sp.]